MPIPIMFSPQTIQLMTRGRPVRIHLFSTGMVAVKTRFREARLKGLLSTVDFILDSRFTDWMPIWVMVIEHPEGIFVIDTGEVTEVNHPGYFRPSGVMANWFDATQFRFSVSREEEIDRQLNALSISVGDVTAVVLTHLHFDHTDGLKYFPNTPIFVARPEWEHPFGALPKLYPSWFKPSLLELDRSYGAFTKACFLTPSEDLALVHTPGHTHGHCSVLLRTDTCHILFAADICYTQDQLIQEKYAANAASRRMTRQTYAVVKAYAQVHPLIFLPSHDAEAGLRLTGLQPVPSPAFIQN